MPRLLVSVRSAAEAEAALAGGADLIDIKEPRHGALGRADDSVIKAVVDTVAERSPVSAALGELADGVRLPPLIGLSFVKAGLAKAKVVNWSEELRRLADRCKPATLVPVAYADWRIAQAPSPSEVLAFAIALRCPVLLVDTWEKAGRTLLDHCPLGELSRMCQRANEAGIAVALAGSLNGELIAEVLPLEPAIIAVRGAACGEGIRDAAVDAEAVRRLAELVHAAHSARKFTTRTCGSRPATSGNHASTTPARASRCQSGG